ncbi:hypothetical protein C8R45DRAFT_1006215 [Mycena sanguinolenta]|nr:hypothetical protein C8R45DRAFT_1006215 [Mycena sanguinolenta]
MDNESPSDEEFTSQSTIGEAGSPYTGAFFPSSQNFVVTGGVFTSNNTHIYQGAPNLPSDFRMVPLGDIDLQHEICLDQESAIVSRRSRRGSVRRMYSARIEGRKSRMTVAVYLGNSAEHDWRQDISIYTSLRHPNLFQIYGAASSCGTYATIIHDDLIPIQHFVELYRDSLILTLYIREDCNVEWTEAWDSLHSICQQWPDPRDCTFWIRRSSGRLCIDHTHGGTDSTPMGPPPLYIFLPSFNPISLDFEDISLSSKRLISLNRSIDEATVISAISIDQYNKMCYWHRSRFLRLSIPSQEPVRMGTVISWSTSSRLERPVAIAFSPEVDVEIFPRCIKSGEEVAGRIMGNGWTRYNSCDVLNQVFIQTICLSAEYAWLSQANHVFSRLQITSDYEDYALVRRIDFEMKISDTPQTPPEGYLFLSPEKDVQIGLKSFCWPECPAHWSLDPSGDVQLTSEEADSLRFPSITLATTIPGYFYDASVYTGLRRFHEGKGFDPDSQDVARHLGLPLFELFEKSRDRFCWLPTLQQGISSLRREFPGFARVPCHP